MAPPHRDGALSLSFGGLTRTQWRNDGEFALLNALGLGHCFSLALGGTQTYTLGSPAPQTFSLGLEHSTDSPGLQLADGRAWVFSGCRESVPLNKPPYIASVSLGSPDQYWSLGMLVMLDP